MEAISTPVYAYPSLSILQKEVSWRWASTADRFWTNICDKNKKRVRVVHAQVMVERDCMDRKLKLRRRLRHARQKYHRAEDKAKRVIRDFHYYKTAHYLLQWFCTIVPLPLIGELFGCRQ